MDVSRKEFNLLEVLAESKATLTQRDIQKKLGVSLGSINKTVKDLTEKNLIANGKITEAGLLALEPFRVKRAVFLAAGFSARLAPITLNTPKPLVKVNGKRIIDGLIDAVISLGIEEIYIVRGYLSEQFDQLSNKYPFIKFLENPVYNESNNISSAVCARSVLSNAYVFEADLILNNQSILKKYHYQSDFLAIKKERTDDWCFKVKDGIIVEEKIGGLNCMQMVGISYWNNVDGKRLSSNILEAYEMPGGKELYWEQVPLSTFKNNYKVEVIPCNEGDIIEIDTFNELKIIDKTYDL